MMKNVLLICICLFGLALPLSAQKMDAQDILDRTATAFRQAGGIQADFTVQTYAKSILQGSSTGVIRLKGEKFLLDADGATSSTEIAAISAKARKNPCFCFLFRDSLSFVRMHMKLGTKRSMAVNT